jgi:hypothetical protein
MTGQLAVCTRNASLIVLTFVVLMFAAGASAQTDATTQPAKPVPAEEKKPDAPATGPSVPNPFNAFKEFTAVMNGGLVADENRKIYRSGKLMRSDFKDQYRVSDIDAPKTWVMMTKDNAPLCSQFPVSDGSDFPFYGLKDFRVERMPADSPADVKETVDGHSCTIDRLSFTKENPPVRLEMKLWKAEDLEGFPVKTEVYNVMTKRRFNITYSDVSLQKPDPKLFVHPAKCNDSAQKVQTGSKGTAAPSKTAPATAPKPAPTTPPQ